MKDFFIQYLFQCLFPPLQCGLDLCQSIFQASNVIFHTFLLGLVIQLVIFQLFLVIYYRNYQILFLLNHRPFMYLQCEDLFRHRVLHESVLSLFVIQFVNAASYL